MKAKDALQMATKEALNLIKVIQSELSSMRAYINGLGAETPSTVINSRLKAVRTYDKILLDVVKSLRSKGLTKDTANRLDGLYNSVMNYKESHTW